VKNSFPKTARCLTAGLLLLTGLNYAAELDDNVIAELSLQLFSVQGDEKESVAQSLAALGDTSLIPTFVLAMRWTGANIHVAKALSDLTGEKLTTWHEAYNWQERHPDIVPHATYRDLKLRFLGNTDKRLRQLFDAPYGNRDKMRIRLEEIVWGGVLYDGIPPLDQASMIKAVDADYLLEDDLVFGIEINGDSRAYPLRIMGWHEMLNDVIGGVPVALAYCTLCGSGILFDTLLEDSATPLLFGSSGLLYRSNKLMFDRKTNSLWNQYSGEPVVGPMADSGIKLAIRPLVITSWKSWRESHPTTTVLALDTGYVRDYGSGVVYREYFASPDLMFPALVNDENRLLRKDYVFGVRGFAASKAWPLHEFKDNPIINDRVGNQSLVLFANAATRTVRAYAREANEIFHRSPQGELLTRNFTWESYENYLQSTDGKHKRVRIPGHISYWFAWENFQGVQSELYGR